MISSPNKNANAGLSLGSRLDFFIIETSLALDDTNNDTNLAPNAAAQALFNTLIETIAINGQPVISSLTTNSAPVAAQFGTLGTPYTGTTYSFKFAVEHTGAWTQDTLAAALSLIALESETTQSDADADLTSTTEYENAVTLNTNLSINASQTQAALISVVAQGADVATAVTGMNTVVTLASQI
jgi:hypothetical protein